MFADYSTFLITIGSLACVAVLGWFFESIHGASASNDDNLSSGEDPAQRQRASLYMIGVLLTMGASVISVIL
jgi:hypothetical protein